MQNFLVVHTVIVLQLPVGNKLFIYTKGMRWRRWLRHCATSWKVAVSSTDGHFEIFV